MSAKLCLRLVSLTLNNTKVGTHLLLRSNQLNNPKPLISALNLTSFRKYSSAINKDEGNKNLVYYGPLTPQIQAVKVFSVTSSIVGLIAQPFLYEELSRVGHMGIIVAAYSFIGFFTFVTPLLLHLITKKYVTHLEFDKSSGEYTAKTYNFFCMTKKHVFKPEEVVVPDVPGMFTTIEVKGNGLFLDPRQFDDPDHYGKLMGFDKPLDFKLYDNPPDNKNNPPK